MKYLSPIQAQKLYGYHPKTLANWADEGKVEYIRTPGGQRRYLASSLESRVSYAYLVESSTLDSR